MVGKISGGGSFAGAVGYVADEREQKQKTKQAQLLATCNLGSLDAAGIAAEMQAVAQGSRCKNPVWHTSLSWPAGEQVTPDQMRQAATAYCQQMGAPLDRHQVAVYQHQDKAHPHIHIIINRVPIDQGPAMDTSHSRLRNKQVCARISEQLGFCPLPPKQTPKLAERQPETPRQRVQQGLQQALGCPNVSTVEELGRELAENGIEASFKHDSGGRLVGASFRVGQEAFKGSEVGYKAAELRTQLEVRQREQKEKQAWSQLFAGYAQAKEAKEAAQAKEAAKNDVKQTQEARKGPRIRF